MATTTYGAGFTNTVTALADAARASVPLVLVTGGAPVTGARPVDVDVVGIARSIGAVAVVVGDGASSDLGAIVGTTIAATIARHRPLVLVLPDGAPPSVDPAEAPLMGSSEVADALVAAHRPLIIAGRGAWLAEAVSPIRQLADRVGAFTATTLRTAGLFRDRQGDLGVAGSFSPDSSRSVFQEADLVLAIGASLNAWTLRSGELLDPATAVLQIDIAPAATSSVVSGYVRGDAREETEKVLEHLPPSSNELLQRRERPSNRLVPEFASDGRLDPRRLMQELDRVLPADRVVACDGGQFIAWPSQYLSVSGPGAFAAVGLDLQAIGLGLGAAVGAAAANPRSTVVLVTGDGGHLMGLPDLEAFVRTVTSGVVVIVDDAAYGAELHLYGHVTPADSHLMPDIDFAAVAAALGAEGVRVDRLADLARLSDWVDAEANGTLLLDCRVSRSVVAPWITDMKGGTR